MTQPVIGFIGLGIMGRPMARHLLNAGYPLRVLDTNPTPVRELVDAGAQAAGCPQEIAQHSQVIITMLPDSPDVEQVCFGEQGLVHGLQPGSIFIDMSTISPATSAQIAEAFTARGVQCLDAPVSGGEVGALNAALSIMVGGEAAALEAVRPILEVMGKTITLCGPTGAGQVVKACNQVQVALNILGMAEAFHLGIRAGVDPNIIHQVLSKGYAQSRVSDVRGPRLIQSDFQPGFKSKLHHKDLKIALQTSREAHAALPVTQRAYELFSSLLEAGGGDLDHSGIFTLLESLANE